MATHSHVDIGALIYTDPDVRDGRPCLAGTAMSVHAVAARYRDGETAEEISADLPDIPPSHLHAAIAYYLADRDRIDAELDAESTSYDELAAEDAHRKASG